MSREKLGYDICFDVLLHKLGWSLGCLQCHVRKVCNIRVCLPFLEKVNDMPVIIDEAVGEKIPLMRSQKSGFVSIVDIEMTESYGGDVSGNRY